MIKVFKPRDYFISVAMATFNGEKYLKEQIDSILTNLQEQDELIISDDGSTDKTIEIIKSYHDTRIQLFEGPKKGFKKNFEFCFSKCNGKYIFIADQDDIWEQDKVEIILKTFGKEKCDCVTHDCVIVASDGVTVLEKSFFKSRWIAKPGILSNIIQSKYYGCCMAFDRKLLEYVLPIPESIVSHDYWIGMLADKYGKSVFIKDKLIRYRRHNSNTSGWHHHLSLLKMIKKRFVIFINIMKR